MKLGSDLGRWDLFWDLFECRYSHSKWLYLRHDSTIPLEIYLHALKRNKNITHITFGVAIDSDANQFQAILCDLPWVTSISWEKIHRSGWFRSEKTLPAIHHDLLFIKSPGNDLITFAKEIRLKLDTFSTYIFTDIERFDMYSGRLRCNARLLISFVAPTSGQSLILRLKHSGIVSENSDAHLEVTLGQTIIRLNNPSSKYIFTIDDINLHPIQDSGTESAIDHTGFLFEPGVRNDIIIEFKETNYILINDVLQEGFFLHDIEVLDEFGLEYPRNSASFRLLYPCCLLISISGLINVKSLKEILSSPSL